MGHPFLERVSPGCNQQKVAVPSDNQFQVIKVGEFGLNPCSLIQSVTLLLRTLVLLVVASWTWDVTHERALSPADLFGGKTPVGA